jgi:hypothetical protein
MRPVLKKSISRTLSAMMTGILAASVLAACSPHSSSVQNAEPVNTGTMESESEFGTLSPEQSVRGTKVFVTSETLRLRTSPEVNDTNIAGTVAMNDQLEIVDSTRVGEQEFIAVKVVKSATPGLSGKTLYTSVNYLSTSAAQRLSPSTGAAEASGQDHFVIVNVATEMIRVYTKCHAPENCKNKMLMEFHGTVGNNSDGMRSDVGVYKTTSWTKFYEVPGEYPGWYRPGYPDLPKKGSRGGWMSEKARPPGFSSFRGAFGWYTVFVGPNNDGQWMHGTIGWGADKTDFVRFQDSFLGGLVGIFAKLGSHGCTRLSNEAIAYMRSNLPVGATLMKVYAKEALKDPSLSGFPKKGELGHFPYIITKLGYGKSNSQHDLAARDSVLKAGTPESEWLEQGTFDYDQTPTPASGDHYKIGGMQGVFNVDEGTLSADYKHPISDRLKVAGYSGRESAIPAFARAEASSPSQRVAVRASSSEVAAPTDQQSSN